MVSPSRSPQAVERVLRRHCPSATHIFPFKNTVNGINGNRSNDKVGGKERGIARTTSDTDSPYNYPINFSARSISSASAIRKTSLKWLLGIQRKRRLLPETTLHCHTLTSIPDFKVPQEVSGLRWSSSRWWRFSTEQRDGPLVALKFVVIR